MSRIHGMPSRLQRGSTLLVAVVILLLASLMALMAMNVGVFEQRTSGNDLRAKIVHQAAEAGLTQGFETLMRGNGAWIDNPALWTKCAAADATFPCGAVPANQRGAMWHLKADVNRYGAAGTDGLPETMRQYMLPNTAPLPAMGAFDVAYGVAPVLCRVPAGETYPVSVINCTDSTDPNAWDPARRVVTFVSVAKIRGDSGRTTLVQTFSRSSLLAASGGVPAVVASGAVSPTGGGDIVAMPDSAGPGLDLAIWTRKDFTHGGNSATCSRVDFLNSTGIAMNVSGWRSQVSNQTKCPVRGGSEGWDILDVDAGTDLNYNVQASEFPCDLFQFAFGVATWKNVVDVADNFCETRIPASEVTLPNGLKVSLYPDEAFLYANAAKVIGGNTAYLRPGQDGTAADLNASASGLIWCISDCLQALNQNEVVGSPENPVVLVLDNPGSSFKPTLYGLVFVRDKNATMSPATGGAAEFKFNSQSAVFGSVLIQGIVPVGSGGGLIFGDRDLLRTLAGSAPMLKNEPLAGGWTDRYSY